MNLRLKKVALATTAAIGFSLISAVPAHAATNRALAQMPAPTATTATSNVGATASTTFKVTNGAAIVTTAGTDTVKVTVSMTSPAGSSVTVSNFDGLGGGNIVTATGQLSTRFSAISLTSSVATLTVGSADIAATTANIIGGTVQIKPDVVGDYVVSLTALAADGTTAVGTAVTYTVSAVSTSATVGSIYISKYSAEAKWAARTASITSDTTSSTVTLVTGTASNFADADLGLGLWSLDGGYIGVISAYSNATVGAAGSITLTANAVTAVTAATDGRVGTVAGTKTASTVISASGINAITLTSGKAAAILVRLSTAPTNSTVAKTRLSLAGTGTIATSAAIGTASLTNSVIPFTVPTMTPGTYTFTVSYSTDASFDAATSKQLDISLAITIVAASQLSTGGSTVYMDAAGTAAGAGNYTADDNAVARSGYKTSGTDLASVEVTLKNGDGTAHALTPTVTASLSGSGFVLVDTTATTTTGISARSSSAAASAGGLAYVHIDADGTAGVGTVTISVTDAITSVTTVLGTVKVTSYGDTTKLEVTGNCTIGKIGGYTTGAANAARTETGEVTNAGCLTASTTTPAFTVKTTDSAAGLVNLRDAAGTAIVPTVVSSDLTVIASGTCVKDDGSSTTYSTGAGTGYYNCSFTTAASSASGKSATLTIRTPNPADRTTYLSTTLAVTVGGATPGTETLSFDKTSYAPGEAMVITRTCKDVAGNSCADGTAADKVVFSKAVGGTAPGASFYVGGKKATSATAPSVFAPALGGAFTAQMTSGNAAGDTVKASSTVTEANAGLLTQIDALNAKIVALNALIAKIMKKLGVK